MLKKIIILLNIFFCFFSYAEETTNNEVSIIAVYLVSSRQHLPELLLILTDNKVEYPLEERYSYGRPDELFNTKKIQITYSTNLFKQAPEELIKCSNDERIGFNDRGGYIYAIIFKDGHINYCGLFLPKELYSDELQLFLNEIDTIINNANAIKYYK